MSREEIVIKRWCDVERYQKLRHWQPPNGAKRRPHIGHYSRIQAIEILEDALTRRHGKGIDITGDDPIADELDAQLAMFYRDLDGTFDHLPLILSSAPKIAQNLMPEMLVECLREWDADSPICVTGLRDSIMQDYLCELTGLKPTQLFLGKRSACLVIRDRAADTKQIYPFDLPEWLVEVNELVGSGWQHNGLMTVRQLRAHLICEVQNSTCKTGNQMYITRRQQPTNKGAR